LLVIVPRLIAGLLKDQDNDLPPMGADIWQDTSIQLPASLRHKSLRNVFTAEAVTIQDGDTKVSVSALLRQFPIGLFSE
jgi:maltooligosyltrehalose synthase